MMGEESDERLAQGRAGRRWRIAVGCAFAVIVAITPSVAPAADGDGQDGGLEAQLRALAEREQVRLFGVELIGGAPVRDAADAGSLTDRLDRLLSGYNYLLTVDERGRPATVRILGNRGQPDRFDPPSAVVVSTTRRGRHHLVPTRIVGRNGASAHVLLLLDTGASTVVLPQSMAETLGFHDKSLKHDVARTAAGTVAVRLGQLREVQVNQARAMDVAVAFVDDATLGDGSLLGMSFLEHFDVRLEDGADRLTLLKR